MTASPSRPDVSTVRQYFSKRVRGVLEVDGSPAAMVVLDPPAGRLGLRIPLGSSEIDLDLPEYRNIEASVVTESGSEWQQLMVGATADLEESYAFVCAVIDRVQLHGASLSEALSGTVEAFEELLAIRRGLTTERQVGLMGELLVLFGLATATNPGDAVTAWRGADREEHDFGLPSADLEVKATTSERRSHWISSVSQLMPTGIRPLFLLSVQWTLGGAGQGLSLPEIAAAARDAVGAHHKELDAKLAGAGFHAADADLYKVRWALRTEPAFYEVLHEFPAITPGRLAAAVPASNRIVDVRYRIDLSSLTPAPALFAITAPDVWKDPT